ncbi:MAG TPA: spermidine/putrescine ABC transporter substrate-binding protein [Jatrophihabitans sp.]|jgi:spermidine/putrescine transport system substrate-binding protein
MANEPGLGPDLARGLTEPRLNRRRFLQIGGLGALGLGLTACGIPGSKSSGGNLGGQAWRDEIGKFWSQQKQTNVLNFENWPLYIDVGKGSDHPSLDLFTKETGIKVNYKEDIQDDASFYGKIAPVLKAGQNPGFDLMVITNGFELENLFARDWLIPLDQSRMSNFYTYASDLAKDPSYDRGNVYTMAWQSGITGIGYNPKLIGKEITSWNDLLDPKLKGKVGMFADNQDLPCSALCAIGVNPEISTPADWTKAADWLKKQRPSVRKYYDQSYIGALKRGDLWASMAWSGDVFASQADNPDLRFVVPKEGAAIWTDNMCIPVHASHPLDAMIYMDYVYQPRIAAMLADYINYITPVSAVQPIFQKEAKAATSKSDKQYYQNLSTSPMIFPKPADFAKLHRYRVLTADEEVKWNALFEPIYQA